MAIKRTIDRRNLVRELAENRVSALELIREALSNAKDHGAKRVWLKTTRDPRTDVSLMIIDDGQGLDQTRFEAFWGIGASRKDASAKSIGYKGHGTKLFFDCQRLSVLSRAANNEPWRLTTLDQPNLFDGDEIEESNPSNHPLLREVTQCDLGGSTGTAVLIEGLKSDDRSKLVSRDAIESYCDWFTVIGDVRSGLFESRVEFHRAVKAGGAATDGLRLQDGDLRPIEVLLRANGDPEYAPIGVRGRFLSAWSNDQIEHRSDPGLLVYGHRFADAHEPPGGASRVRDDRSARRLTTAENWTDGQISIVARVEGHRRQTETYLEASWSGHQGLFSFEDRFGLWLCKDFIPVVHRNDLLREALSRGSRQRLKFDLGRFRNWQVFVNDQSLKLTANRNGVSNQTARDGDVVDALVLVLERALKERGFREWVDRLQAAALERDRNREVEQIRERLDAVKEWIGKEGESVDPMAAEGLPLLPEDYSLRMRPPRSEQELFYVYGLLSGRYEVPLHFIDYDASEGVDAIAQVRDPKLTAAPFARVELKLRVEAGVPIHHFFESIDVMLCWEVGRVGEIYEETSATAGKLRRRSPSLTPAFDAYEIAYTQGHQERVIPVLELRRVFPSD